MTQLDRSTFAYGMLFAFLAAMGYTAANGFLRALADNVDATFVSAVKACWTMVLFGPPVAWITFRKGRSTWPSTPWILGLIAVGAATQLLGNLPIQWAFYYLGMAVTVPIVLSTMIVWSTLIGWWLLGERVSGKVLLAVTLLIAATFVLIGGASRAKGEPTMTAVAVEQAAGDPVELGTRGEPWVAVSPIDWWKVAAGVAAAMLAGLAFAALGIALRKSAQQNVSNLIPMVLVSFSGIVVLGSVTLLRNGPEIFGQTSGGQWLRLSMAGICNSGAFLSLSLALRALPVVYVNGVNASQAILAALVGYFFFAEQPTIYLAIGIVLSVTGFLLMTQPKMKRTR